jgi:hypothetical protein
MDRELISTYVLEAAEKYGLILDLYDIHKNERHYMVTLWINNAPSKLIVEYTNSRIDAAITRTKVNLHIQALSLGFTD